MKVMLEGHKERLKRAQKERFIDECVLKLEELDYKDPYPKNRNRYREFIEAGYDNAALYGLDDFPHHTYAYMVAWHIKGKQFIEHDEALSSFFNDVYIPSFAKFEKLLDMIGEHEEAIAQIKEMI